MPIIELTGKKALINGADGDMGRAIALNLAERGIKLALVGRDAEALMRTAALTGRPLDMLVLPVELEKPRAMQDIMRIMTGHFKMLDLLVNCADNNAGDYEREMAINTKAPFLLCQKTLSLLRQSECPCIVNIGAPMEALRGVTRALANEAAPENIRMHMIGVDLPLKDETMPDEIAELVVFLVERRGKSMIDEIRIHG